MHRSGTSMVSNLVYELGLNFGDRQLLQSADQWNAKGYFENSEIICLNDRLLLGNWVPAEKFLSTDTKQLSIFTKGAMAFARAKYLGLMYSLRGVSRRVFKNRSIIENLSKKYDNAVVKDPRFSILIGPWKHIGNVEKILYCLRHPHEVAQSLRKRSSVPMWLSYRLWHFHVREFLRQAQGIPTVIVNYSSFFQESAMYNELERIFSFVGTEFDPVLAHSLLQQVVDSGLKNNSYSGSPVPQRVLHAYQGVMSLHARHDNLLPLCSDLEL